MSLLFVTNLSSYWFAQLKLCKSVIKLQIFGIFVSLDVQSCSFQVYIVALSDLVFDQ